MKFDEFEKVFINERRLARWRDGDNKLIGLRRIKNTLTPALYVVPHNLVIIEDGKKWKAVGDINQLPKDARVEFLDMYTIRQIRDEFPTTPSCTASSNSSGSRDETLLDLFYMDNPTREFIQYCNKVFGEEVVNLVLKHREAIISAEHENTEMNTESRVKNPGILDELLNSVKSKPSPKGKIIMSKISPELAEHIRALASRGVDSIDLPEDVRALVKQGLETAFHDKPGQQTAQQEQPYEVSPVTEPRKLINACEFFSNMPYDSPFSGSAYYSKVKGSFNNINVNRGLKIQLTNEIFLEGFVYGIMYSFSRPGWTRQDRDGFTMFTRSADEEKKRIGQNPRNITEIRALIPQPGRHNVVH